jgi:hypothetical protein
MMNITKWNNYKQGEVICYGWKLDRVQARITDSHYINNFIDFVKTNKEFLYDIDKIILLGDYNPIALYPKNAQDINQVYVYLESIKNTDINTIVLSLGDNSGVFVNGDLLEDILAELNAKTKIDVRFVLSE